jgi:hypothetical protein
VDKKVSFDPNKLFDDDFFAPGTFHHSCHAPFACGCQDCVLALLFAADVAAIEAACEHLVQRAA